MPSKASSTPKKRSTSTRKPSTKKVEERRDILTIDAFLDRAVYFGQIKDTQRAELKAWFKDHRLNNATETDFQNLLEAY